MKQIYQKRKFQKWIKIILVAVFVFSNVLLVQAASLTELQKQKASLDAKIEANKKASETKQKQAEALKSTINQLSSDIQNTQNRIGQTQSQINGTQHEIDLTNSSIEKKQNELNLLKKQQDESIRALYTLVSESNTLEVLIESKNLSDVVEQNNYLESLETRIDATITEVKALKLDLEKQKADLEKKQKDLSDLKGQQEAQKKGLENQQSTKDKLLKNTQYTLDQLNKEQQEYLKLEAQVEAQIWQIIAAQRKKQTAQKIQGKKVSAGDVIGYEGNTGNSFGPHVHLEVRENAVGDSLGDTVNPRNYIPSKYRWPLDEFVVTQEYGSASCTYCGYSFHSGIDLAARSGGAADPGAPVRAASSGMIIMDQYFGGYGNAVVIEHDNNVLTLYGHLM